MLTLGFKYTENEVNIIQNIAICIKIFLFCKISVKKNKGNLIIQLINPYAEVTCAASIALCPSPPNSIGATTYSFLYALIAVSYTHLRAHET